MLKRVFTLPHPPTNILFKGGTSLSKAFGLIERFSEDIDLVLDRHGLGFTAERDPACSSISGKQRSRLIDELRCQCRHVIHEQLMPMLTNSITESLGHAQSPDTWTVSVAEDDPDGQTILFNYPLSHQANTSYVRPQVRLELGARGDHWPDLQVVIEPYAAKTHPRPFGDARTPVRALSPERTFWEKATILHALYHKPAGRPIGERQSRHYYDLARLAQSPLGEIAAENLALLSAVVAHKSAFFHTAWAKYEEAKPGTLRLIPPPHRATELRQDYADMAEMFFGNYPTWDAITALLATLESKINQHIPHHDHSPKIKLDA